MGKIQQLAQIALDNLHQIPMRGDWKPGDRVPLFWDWKEDAPKWAIEVCLEAHEKNDMMPNPTRMEYIRDSLERITTFPDDYKLHQVRTEIGGYPRHWVGNEDIDYDTLARWWVSHIWRDDYATMAIKSGVNHRTITEILQHAQRIEMSRTFGQLLTALQNLSILPPKHERHVNLT